MYPLVWAKFHNILSLDKEISILPRAEVKYTEVCSDNLSLLVQHKLRGLDDYIMRYLSRHFESLQCHIKYVLKLTFDQSKVLPGINPVCKLLSECNCDIINAVYYLDFEFFAVILVETFDHLLSEFLDLPDS